MSRYLKSLIAASIATTGVAGLDSRNAASAQAANLTGSTLPPLEDVETLFDGSLQHLSGGGRKRPTRPVIERVVVSEDSPRRLVVTVTYRGLEETTLTGEVRGMHRHVLTEIEPQPVALTESNGQATLAFELRGALNRDVAFESAYLRISAIEGRGRAFPIASRNFALRKDWSAKAGPANTVLRVAAKPIATAAGLGAHPTTRRRRRSPCR